MVTAGRPFVVDGCVRRWNYGTELWGSRDVLELVEVSQLCYSPASLQALE